MLIEDLKIVYPEFKFFKGIYTQINKSDYIIFHKGSSNSILLDFFENDLSYYILRGELTGDTEFIKWINSNNIICNVSLETIKLIKSEKKADCISISYDENSFTFKSAANEVVIKNEPNLKKVIDQRDHISRKLVNAKNLPVEFFQDDICEIFEKDGEITLERTDHKILEVATKKIVSIIKDYNKSELLLDNREDKNKAYIGLRFENSDIGLSLTQMFATILLW